MSDVRYEPVREPPDPARAFLRDDAVAAQAQAAVLLAMAWELSGDDMADFDEETAGYLGVGLSAERAPGEGERVSAGEVNDRVATYGALQSSEARHELFVEYQARRELSAAAALFRLSLDSADPLVQVAAATGYLETGLEPELALEVLHRGVEQPSELVRVVAQTTIGRLAPERQRPELPGLDQAGPAQALETTLLVHGTFARREAWWQQGGDFHTYLMGVMPDLYSARDAFSWSGAYSDAARLLAASELVQWFAGHPPAESADDPLSLVAHSHGGSVAMLASWAPLPMERLVLLSCPVHRKKYYPCFDQIGRVAAVRVHCDLVILADRGGQRFHDDRIAEITLPIWFNHSATHDPSVWASEDLPSQLP